MRTFDSLATRIQPYVQNCPFPTIMQTAREATIRVCRETLAWRSDSGSIILSPGIIEYFYPVSTEQEVVAVFEAALDCKPLKKLTLLDALRETCCWPSSLENADPLAIWASSPEAQQFNTDQFNENPFNQISVYIPNINLLLEQRAGTPRTFTELSRHKFVVLPPPDANGLLRFVYALAPSYNANAMPKHVMDVMEDAIVYNTLTMLCSMMNTPWESENKAATFGAMYAEEAYKLRRNANHTAGMAPLMARGFNWA